ncbi:MAG TPA: LysR family transcriptional regulator [Steroidobacteraceae bacterium]|nr:LysR family transcriptional regulator [Steroidobacteraceae bacterium]
MPAPRLNYQHLLYFWTVVRTGSIARACEELHLSAPAVSAQLKTLESRLGQQLLVKSGRTLTATDVGKLVFGYANEIFDLGQDLLQALEQRPTHRPLRFTVGIHDVLPKEVVQRLLEPALQIGQPVRLTCREGSLDRLVADLTLHESDLVISDAPFTPALNFRVYSHHLGSTAVCWMARAKVAAKLRRGFPQSLNGAPLLLPTLDTAIRHTLNQWMDGHQVHPSVAAEFEDYALLRAFARAGYGVAPVPVVLEEQFRQHYGLLRVGLADAVRNEFYAISVERKVKHPAVAAIIESARQLFDTTSR